MAAMIRVLLLTILLFSSSASADVRISASLGPLFQPGLFRAGTDRWELGFFNTQALGALGLLFKDNLYVAMGPVISSHFGLGGAVGWERAVWSKLHLRAEANAFGTINGYTAGELQVGITLRF